MSTKDTSSSSDPGKNPSVRSKELQSPPGFVSAKEDTSEYDILFSLLPVPIEIPTIVDKVSNTLNLLKPHLRCNLQGNCNDQSVYRSVTVHSGTYRTYQGRSYLGIGVTEIHQASCLSATICCPSYNSRFGAKLTLRWGPHPLRLAFVKGFWGIPVPICQSSCLILLGILENLFDVQSYFYRVFW